MWKKEERKQPELQDCSGPIKCKMAQKQVLNMCWPTLSLWATISPTLALMRLSLLVKHPLVLNFTTRVLAPLPRSTGNTDKRAIIVLLFRVPHELLTFLEDLAKGPFFIPSPPIWMISGQLPAQNRVNTGQWIQPCSPLVEGCKLSKCNIEVSLHPFFFSQIQIDLMYKGLIYMQVT